MPNIFNLAKIAQIVESQRPACILVVDTNVLMEEPDPSNWKVTAGPTLFVLSDLTIMELEFIRQRQESRGKVGSQEKATEAIRTLTKLFKKGTITEGIPINAGWVIGVPSPNKHELDIELEQLQDIMKAFKRTDTMLLLLTRECSQSFVSTPVVLITRDLNLSNVVQMNGVPCHLCTGFPIEGLEEIVERIRLRPVDWDQILEGIDDATKQNAIVVEATLTSQRSAPPWLMAGAKSFFIIAEGYGVVRYATEKRSFLWTIPFYPQTLISTSRPSDKSAPDPLLEYSIYLDFSDEDNPEQDLFDAIADRLLDCTKPLSFVYGMPTLQNPESVMEMLLYLEYNNREGMSVDNVERLLQELEESAGLTIYWADWILGEQDDDRFASLAAFIEAVRSCWKLGQSYVFSVMMANKEHLEE